MLRRLLPLLLLAGCAPAADHPERVIERRTSEAPAPRGPERLRAAMLRAHNDARAGVGVAPLAWDDHLAADARAYAEQMARTGVFAHAAQPPGPGHEGENLWTGTRAAYTYDEMAAAWVAEGRDFVNAPTPDSSRTGRWQDVAHYTQIVWRGTTTVGCAVAAGREDEYLVCRYVPAGNVVGWRAF